MREVLRNVLEVAALRAHPQAAGVQEAGCAAVAIVCSGFDAAGLAHKQRAAAAGAKALLERAHAAFPQPWLPAVIEWF